MSEDLKIMLIVGDMIGLLDKPDTISEKKLISGC